MSEKKYFWTSLPGILTGIAAIIAAVGGLYQIGVFSTRPVIQSSTNSSPSGVPPPIIPDTEPLETSRPNVPSQGRGDPGSSDILVDPRTGLMWTRTDNGYDINWHGADRYCKGLTLEGYTGWELPTIRQLEGIYDPNNVTGKDTFTGTGTDYEIHTISGFRLSAPYMWSSTRRDSESIWDFGFGNGKRGPDHLDFSLSSRALCVRRSGE